MMLSKKKKSPPPLISSSVASYTSLSTMSLSTTNTINTNKSSLGSSNKTPRSKRTTMSARTYQRSNMTHPNQYKPNIIDVVEGNDDDDNVTTTSSVRSILGWLQQLQLLKKNKNNDNNNNRKKRKQQQNNNSNSSSSSSSSVSKGMMMLFWMVLMMMTIDKVANVVWNTSSNDAALLANRQQPWEETTSATTATTANTATTATTSSTDTLTQSQKQLLLRKRAEEEQQQEEQKNGGNFVQQQQQTQQQPQEKQPHAKQPREKQPEEKHHFTLDLPHHLKYENTQNQKKMNTLRSMETENTTITNNSTQIPVAVYNCLPNIHVDTIYKFEHIHLPRNITSFTIRIINTNHQNQTTDNNNNNNNNNSTDINDLLNDLFPNGFGQVLFSFPNGFGNEELISGEDVMTIQDVKQKMSTYDSSDTTIAIIEQYIQDQLPTMSDDNNNITSCPDYQHPSASPSRIPSNSPSTSSPSSSGSPTFHYHSSNHHENDTLPEIAFLPSGQNRYNNSNPVDGPWEECLGWEGEDCRDYILAIVPDAPRFNYYAVAWEGETTPQNSNTNGTDTGNNNNNDPDNTTTPIIEPDDWDDHYDDDKGHWYMIGASSVEGNVQPSHHYSHTQRVFVVVNKDNIVINKPTRG